MLQIFIFIIFTFTETQLVWPSLGLAKSENEFEVTKHVKQDAADGKTTL
jgi:hypothetical protein